MGDLVDFFGKKLTLKNASASSSSVSSSSVSSSSASVKCVEKVKCHKCILEDPEKSFLGSRRIEYNSFQWHYQCFICSTCKIEIGTNHFIPRGEDIYCPSCYQEKYSPKCAKCKKIIKSGGVLFNNDPLHKDCFACAGCKTPLGGQKFATSEDGAQAYCGGCYDDLYSKRCKSCKKSISIAGGSRFVEFEDTHWHSECFRCVTCKVSMVSKGFVMDEGNVTCPPCARRRPCKCTGKTCSKHR